MSQKKSTAKKTRGPGKGPTKDDLRDMIKSLKDIIDNLITKFTITKEAAAKTTEEMVKANEHIAKLVETVNANVNLSTKSVTLLDKTFEEKKFIDSLKRGAEDQTKALSGLDIKFSIFSAFLSGILTGFEPIIDFAEETGEMIGETLRPLMDTIAEGLITWLPVLANGLDGVSFVLTPLASGIGQVADVIGRLLEFLSPVEGASSEAFAILNKDFVQPRTEEEFFDFIRDWIDAILGNTAALEERQEDKPPAGLVQDPFD